MDIIVCLLEFSHFGLRYTHSPYYNWDARWALGAVDNLIRYRTEYEVRKCAWVQSNVCVFY